MILLLCAKKLLSQNQSHRTVISMLLKISRNRFFVLLQVHQTSKIVKTNMICTSKQGNQKPTTCLDVPASAGYTLVILHICTIYIYIYLVLPQGCLYRRRFVSTYLRGFGTNSLPRLTRNTQNSRNCQIPLDRCARCIYTTRAVPVVKLS